MGAYLSKPYGDYMHRITVELPDDVIGFLNTLTQDQKIGRDEAVRRAIATEYYFKTQPKGTKVLLQTPEDEFREVMWR